MSTISLLDLFQIITHVFIIYLKHCYVNTLNKFTTLIYILTLKNEKSSIGYMFVGFYYLNVLVQCYHVITYKNEKVQVLVTKIMMVMW